MKREGLGLFYPFRFSTGNGTFRSANRPIKDWNLGHCRVFNGYLSEGRYGYFF
jgi:hypothetical protein